MRAREAGAARSTELIEDGRCVVVLRHDEHMDVEAPIVEAERFSAFFSDGFDADDVLRTENPRATRAPNAAFERGAAAHPERWLREKLRRTEGRDHRREHPTDEATQEQKAVLDPRERERPVHEAEARGREQREDPSDASHR